MPLAVRSRPRRRPRPACSERRPPHLLQDAGTVFAQKVQQFETEFLDKLEEIYQTLSEQVLQSLRRRLPITRTKLTGTSTPWPSWPDLRRAGLR